jgi:hypothetical protein
MSRAAALLLLSIVACQPPAGPKADDKAPPAQVEPAVSRQVGWLAVSSRSTAGNTAGTWYDSRQTRRRSVRARASSSDGSTIDLEAVDVDGPPARKSRTETALSAGGGRIVYRQFNPCTDGNEHLLMELVLTRKPAPRR